jgi:hypothetical protein
VSARLTTRYVAGRDLTPRLRDEIWEFYSRFVERSRPRFEEGLAAMDEVFLTREGREGPLVGFGAARLFTVELEGRRYGMVYTGWGAVDPRHRGRNVVQRAGIHFLLGCWLRHPLVPLYWLYGASTYRSYRMMLRNFAECWPHPARPWPERELRLRELAMRRLADPAWDPATGVIRRHGASRYREGVVADDPAALADPDVRFYASLNPGQAEGDTLVCLAAFSARGWLLALRRMAARALRRLLPSPSRHGATA